MVDCVHAPARALENGGITESPHLTSGSHTKISRINEGSSDNSGVPKIAHISLLCIDRSHQSFLFKISSNLCCLRLAIFSCRWFCTANKYLCIIPSPQIGYSPPSSINSAAISGCCGISSRSGIKLVALLDIWIDGIGISPILFWIVSAADANTTAPSTFCGMFDSNRDCWDWNKFRWVMW